jgi:hypothetical protein
MPRGSVTVTNEGGASRCRFWGRLDSRAGLGNSAITLCGDLGERPYDGFRTEGHLGGPATTETQDDPEWLSPAPPKNHDTVLDE